MSFLVCAVGGRSYSWARGGVGSYRLMRRKPGHVQVQKRGVTRNSMGKVKGSDGALRVYVLKVEGKIKVSMSEVLLALLCL